MSIVSYKYFYAMFTLFLGCSLSYTTSTPLQQICNKVQMSL